MNERTRARILEYQDQLILDARNELVEMMTMAPELVRTLLPADRERYFEALFTIDRTYRRAAMRHFGKTIPPYFSQPHGHPSA